MIKTHRITNGYLSENCYIVYDESSALIIDPGSEKEPIIEFINNNKLKVLGVLITHYHFDHTECLSSIVSHYNTVVIDYKSDKDIIINNFKFKIIDCYGHTLDSVSYYFYMDNIIFTGDFLFKGTIGNYKNINEKYMIDSLKNIKNYNKNIIIYPGHGESSTINDELLYNPYLRQI